MRASVKISLACLCLIATSGCIIPYPNTTQSSPEIRGRVLDATTHKPIQGAQIAVIGRPNTTVISDASGSYHLPAYHSFHLAFMPGICGSYDLPQGLPYTDTIDFTCTNYLPVRIDSAADQLFQKRASDNDPMVLHDVFMETANK